MKFLLYINIILLFVACGNSDKSVLKDAQKPMGISKMNEIVIISDQDVWEGATGDTLRYYFQSAYPLIPTPEPMFDLRHFTPLQLKEGPLRKTLRTYLIIADLGDKDSETTKMVIKDMGNEKYNRALEDPEFNSLMGSNKWAQKQLVTYVFGANAKSLQKNIADKYPTIAKKVRMHDEGALEGKVYSLGVKSNKYRRKLNEDFGVDLPLSSDYKEAVYDVSKNIAWFRRDVKKGIQNIVVQKFPYTSDEQFTTKYMSKIVDDFGKEYVTSTTEGSHLVVNGDDLPILETNLKNGALVKEYRGIWEMTKDFYGGPFATYVYKTKDEVVFVTAFVLALGSKKRDMMMQMDYIAKKNYK